MSLNSGMRNLGARGYGLSGSGHSNMVVGLIGGDMAGVNGTVRGEGSQYEMFDAESESQCGSHSGGASSVGTCYEDAHSDGYEESGTVGELAFGDRIY
jgi:hypothetical protein